MSTFITVLPVICFTTFFLLKLLEHQFSSPGNSCPPILLKILEHKISYPENSNTLVLFKTVDQRFSSPENSCTTLVLFKTVRFPSPEEAHIIVLQGYDRKYRNVNFLCWLCLRRNGLTAFLERNQLKSILIKGSKSAIPSEKDVSPMWMEENSSVILEKIGFYRSVLANLGF